MFIYVFLSVTCAHTINKYIVPLFTLYNIHNNCTKGSQSRERHMALPGANELIIIDTENSYIMPNQWLLIQN